MAEPDLKIDIGTQKLNLPMTLERDQKTVRDGFWKKLTRVAGKIPFAEDAAAAWYCARDPKTPLRVKATLMAALAYFVLPTDMVPDFIAGFGFTDDATVLMATIGLVSSHLTEAHRKAARVALNIPEKPNSTHSE